MLFTCFFSSFCPISVPASGSLQITVKERIHVQGFTCSLLMLRLFTKFTTDLYAQYHLDQSSVPIQSGWLLKGSL